MNTDHAPLARRSGLAGIAAGILLFLSVAGEIVVSAQQPNGTVEHPALFAVYLALWTAGSVSLVAALWGLRRLHQSMAAPRGRTGRIGLWFSLTGSALLALFGVVVLATALANGAPLEASFLLFALGFLLLMIGQIMVGLGARRIRSLGSSWSVPIVGAVGIFVALGVSVDPFHDIGLFIFDAAWVLTGVVLVRSAANAAAAVEPVSARRAA